MIWWNSNLLTVGYISSIINVFSLDGDLIGSCRGAPSTAVCHLQWHSESQNLLWVGGYMGLTLIEIECVEQRCVTPVDKVVFTIINFVPDESTINPPSIRLTTIYDRSLHQTAGCGIYLDGMKLISGDLSGYIFHWSIDNFESTHNTQISDSVRCFISEDLVGTLSGVIYNSKTGEPVENFESTVICSAWNKDKTSCLVGLGDGRLIDLRTKKLIGLHENNAEIWSVCWSPDEKRCATASEDQTTCIWQIAEEKTLVAQLTGHTTAVTGVQWKSNRIYTCADDRTVRIYEENHSIFSCIRVLRTPKSLFGWFTLTYLQVDEEERLIICTTQNGYLVVWRDDLSMKNDLPILCKKIHFGSLEGLAYDAALKRVAIISSDCSVTCLRLHLN